jgi:hypothetical protein
MQENEQPPMSLKDAARLYIREHNIVRREALYAANRFTRLVGPVDFWELTDAHRETFIEKARAVGFTSRSIQTTLKDLRTVEIYIKGEAANARKFPAAGLVEPGEPIDDPGILSLSVCTWAKQYTEQRGIVRREVIYSANRYTRVLGPVRVSSVNTAQLVEFREECQKLNLNVRTIESNISDIMTLVKAARGILLDPGRRLRPPRPEPCPVPLKTLEACWPHCPGWLQQWIVLSYWTGLRLTDAQALQLNLTDEVPELLKWKASKTGHWHRWPVVEWLHPWLTKRTLPYPNANDFGSRTIRMAIADACRKVSVPEWKPKFLRQYSLSQWMRVSPAAGQVVHGCGLNGVLKHYIDPMTILDEAGAKLFVPPFFRVGPQKPQEASLAPQDLFSQLDEKTRSVMLQTMRAMLWQA